jgi:rhomboid-like protein
MKPPESFSAKVGMPGVRNQVLFAFAGSCLAFIYAAVNTNIETEAWAEKLVTLSPLWSISSVDIKRAQNAEVIKQLRDWYAKLNANIQNFPALMKPWISLAYVTIMQPYADMSEGKRLCWKICLFNAAIYGVWKFKRLQPFMMHSFTHNPLSGLSYTMLTSVFSHKSFLHLLFNCLALESFGSAAYYYLVRDQGKASLPMLESSATYHFLAFFVSAGLFSSLASQIVTAKLRFPKLVVELASPASLPRKADTWAQAVSATVASSKTAAVREATSAIRPSLGASGAIYACVTMTALAFPESQVALFIPPTYPIPIQWGVGGLVMRDIIGISRGWRMFDHWAHLGGAAFGVFYYNYGPPFWHWLRQSLQTERKMEERTANS